MEEKLYLRQATTDDAKLLFDWANDVEVRQNSFNTEQIAWDEHIAWLERVLADENTLLYILIEDDVPVGQVRLANDGKWQISYSIAPAYRGQGYGKLILQLAENELIKDGHIGEMLYAEVKNDNIASQRIFEGLKYVEAESQHERALGYEKSVNKDVYEIIAPESTGGGQSSF